MKTRKSVIETYRDFYGSFCLIVKDIGLHPYKLEFTSVKSEDGASKVRLKEPVFLSQWPISKVKGHYQHVDILVDVHFVYMRDNLLHTRSSVCLTYFKRDKQKNMVEAFENLRFDFHPETGDIDHPLLHAHVFASGKPELEADPAPLRDYTIDWKFLETRLLLNALRIPIPNMTFPSVLCCLVACHLGPAKLKDLLNKTREARQVFPHLDIPKAQSDLLFDNSFAGSQWFERP